MHNLLIIEDDAYLRNLYRGEFERSGFHVILAADHNEAVQRATSGRPDIVILEIGMSSMEGIETIEKLLQIRKNLPIIVNSKYASYLDDFRCWAASAVIIKSDDLTELKNKVNYFTNGNHAPRNTLGFHYNKN